MIELKSKNILNHLLIKRGFSKRSFANYINIPVATFVQISNGKQSPRPLTAKKICDGLEAEFDELFQIKD